MTDATHWLDQGNNIVYSFGDDGMFVDADGKGPQKGFLNNDTFSDWLHAYVEDRLQQAGLVKVLIPDDPKGAPIYHTPGALDAPDDLLILICGSGRIHVGVWSVGVCAYHGLAAGTVLPCLEEAQRRNMAVIILNPNHEGAELLPREYQVDFGMVNHTLYVFDQLLVNKNDAKRVFIIAHSMGAECTSFMINSFPEWAVEKVVAIALTDGFPDALKTQDLRTWCLDRTINWVRSEEELNAPLEDGPMFRTRSAGTTDHPLTTHKAFPFIWVFFDHMAGR
jgi:hypothetical protein